MSVRRCACFSTSLLSLCAPAFGQVATPAEAEVAATNWLQLVIERDGGWGNSGAAALDPMVELRSEPRLLGYLFPVQPKGYILVSALKDFEPIKAYSATSDFSPAATGGGASAMLTGMLDRRTKELERVFGGLDDKALSRLKEFTPDAARTAWQELSVPAGGNWSPAPQARDGTPCRVGPLLHTSWHQDPPYNNLAPNLGCSFSPYNQNALAGCVPIAMAQTMRHFAWPPIYGPVLEWEDVLDRYDWDQLAWWFRGPDGNLVTQAQMDEVAHLVSVAAGALEDDVDYGCESTGAHICSFWFTDARDGFEDHLSYHAPDCEDRDDNSYEGWWNILVEELNHNRPVIYSIEGDGFHHAIVVDGYDCQEGRHLVHANYGWDNGHTMWYALDHFDCAAAGGYQGGCDANVEEMVRGIYPVNGLCDTWSGTLDPSNMPVDLPHYIYCDLTSNNMQVQGGAWVQFLPGVRLTGQSTGIHIAGRSPKPTRFYSDGRVTRGLKVESGGQIVVSNGGSLRLP